MTDDTLTVFLCQTCGTSFSPAATTPDACPICEDDRQFVPPSCQGWTTLPELHVGYRNTWERPEENLFVIQTEPDFGIGQRCFLARTPGGNVLWDCIALLDDATIGIIEGLGGLAAIAISHPHLKCGAGSQACRPFQHLAATIGGGLRDPHASQKPR